jgi:hypothetical protein
MLRHTSPAGDVRAGVSPGRLPDASGASGARLAGEPLPGAKSNDIRALRRCQLGSGFSGTSRSGWIRAPQGGG